MLTITIPAIEGYDDDKEEFVTIEKERVLQLEHSLVSLSKWESKHHKPFLSKKDKTLGEYIDYIRCMTITQNVDPKVYLRVNRELIDKIAEYIDDPMTATTVSNLEKSSGREIITAEIIYYRMISFNIPFECQKWHLNRLLTLINVCNAKNKPKKPLKGKALMRRNSALNRQRRQRLGSRG